MALIDLFKILLLVFLVGCAIAAAFSRSMLVTVIIFMSYGAVMSIIWVLLRAPDLAITEAAVGVGINSLLLFVTLKKLNLIRRSREEGDEHGQNE